MQFNGSFPDLSANTALKCLNLQGVHLDGRNFDWQRLPSSLVAFNLANMGLKSTWYNPKQFPRLQVVKIDENSFHGRVEMLYDHGTFSNITFAILSEKKDGSSINDGAKEKLKYWKRQSSKLCKWKLKKVEGDRFDETDPNVCEEAKLQLEEHCQIQLDL